MATVVQHHQQQHQQHDNGVRKSRPSRIPATFQAIFLAANRGMHVSEPPPNHVAMKDFGRGGTSTAVQQQPQADKSKYDVDSSGRTSRSAFRLIADALKGSKKRDSNKRSNHKQIVPPSEAGLSIGEIVIVQQNKGEVLGLNNSQHKKSTNKANVERKKKNKNKQKDDYSMSPQTYLDLLLHSRGYSTRRTRTLFCAYHNLPTPLQQASYDVHLISLIRQRKVKEFNEIMASGISPNPCNSFGESLLHHVCRRGDHDLLRVMLDNGTDLQVVDDYGRTPLHDACWSFRPCFDVIETILDVDKRMFHMTDRRGSVPLSYAHKDHWPEWIKWIDSKKDVYWPPRDPMKSGHESLPPLAEQAPNSRPAIDPKNALPVDLARMVSSGRITAAEAAILVDDDDDDDDGDSTSDESDYDNSDSDSHDFEDYLEDEHF